MNYSIIHLQFMKYEISLHKTYHLRKLYDYYRVYRPNNAMLPIIKAELERRNIYAY